MRKLLVLVLLVLTGLGAYVGAGRLPPPAITIASPDRFVGQSTPLDITVDGLGTELSVLRVVFEQAGRETELFALGGAADDASDVVRAADVDGRVVHLAGSIGPTSLPDLRSGPATILVSAARPVLYGLRQRISEITHDVDVRLEPPRVSVLSMHHFVNVGGSEVVVYRVSPDDVESGVVVGDQEYPGYPAAGARGQGIGISDPSVRVAFFALLYDQDPGTPIALFARDQAGNSTRVNFDYRVFPKPARQSRIDLDAGFIERVVPAILARTTEIVPQGTTLDRFLAINGELRRKNAATIAAFAERTSAEMQWDGTAFYPFTNTAVESAFADRRTYFFEGREVDRQVHLGFDLASFAGTAIAAAHRGTVLFADELGIYGNCVIIDHGMGLQSLYAHLSAFEVGSGDLVERGQTIGRSGMTGLAGGDHLHFTMLVAGRMVNPLEWWDAHWIDDRITRKLTAVSAP